MDGPAGDHVALVGSATLASRRDFVGSATRWLAVGAAAGAASVVDACALNRHAPSFSAAFDVSSLTADGTSLITPSAGPDGARILIVRESGSQYLALSMQCTHEGCPVNPPAGGVITCPCHGSQFDLAGRLLKGPAQFPLGHYDVTVNGRTGWVVVSLP